MMPNAITRVIITVRIMGAGIMKKDPAADNRRMTKNAVVITWRKPL